MLDVHHLPALNAALNSLSAAFLLAGWIFVRRRRLDAHRASMIAAGAASLLFLASYLTYHAQVGSVRFRSEGILRTVYFSILLTHTVLAAVIVPLVAVTLRQALVRRFDRHRRVARWTWPLWMVVSVTGIVIYFMLYHLDPALVARAQVRPAAAIRITPDVVYGHKAGMALTFDVYRPAKANGAAVLFINSGGFVSGQICQYDTDGPGELRFVPPDQLHLEGETEALPLLGQFSFAPLLEAGFAVFDVRHGGSPPFKLPEIVADARRAVRHIVRNAARFEVDADRIGLWGASSGGYLALQAALADDPPGAESPEGAGPARVRAVAVYYPAGFDLAGDARRFPNLIESLPALQVEPAVLDSLSLRHAISPGDPPCLIIYGTGDFPFITEPSESVDVALTRAGVACRRIAIPGTGHEFRGPDGYQPEHGGRAAREVVTWFEETLTAR